MPHDCYSLISIWGNKKAIDEVEKWKSQVTQRKEQNGAEKLRELLILIDSEKSIDLADCTLADDGAMDVGIGQIGLVCRPGRPDQLEIVLTKALFNIDKNVVIYNDYQVEDGSRGASLTMILDGSDIKVFDSFYQYDPEEYDDRSVAAEDFDTYINDDIDQFTMQIESINPRMAETIKKHRKNHNLTDIEKLLKEEFKKI